MADNKEIGTSIQESFCKEFGIDFAILGEIYARKLLWHKYLQNEVDYCGMAQRIVKDISNILFSTPVRIYTSNPLVNDIIGREVYGRMRFNEVFPQKFAHFLGIGDGILTAYRDPIDGLPAINYIPSYNVVPITYNNHNVSELVWFNSSKIDDKMIYTCVIERLKEREVRLYEGEPLNFSMIETGSPLWNKVMGPNISNKEVSVKIEPAQKFAWVSSGLFNPRWIDTPFHNSVIWPIWLITALEKDYKLLQEEYKNSMKKIFINSDLVKNTINMNPDTINHQPHKIKQFDPSSTLFETLDLGEEMIKEWNPIVRFNEFKSKISFDMQFLGQQIGMGSQFYNIDNPKVEMTATQVILENRDAYNTINTIKNILEPAIRIIIRGLMDYWIDDGLMTEADIPPFHDIGIEFDDGVFINKGAKVNEGTMLYQAKLIDQYTFLTRYENYTEGEASEIINRTQQEKMMEMQMMMAMTPPSDNLEDNKKDKKDKKDKKKDK